MTLFTPSGSHALTLASIVYICASLDAHAWQSTRISIPDFEETVESSDHLLQVRALDVSIDQNKSFEHRYVPTIYATYGGLAAPVKGTFEVLRSYPPIDEKIVTLEGIGRVNARRIEVFLEADVIPTELESSTATSYIVGVKRIDNRLVLWEIDGFMRGEMPVFPERVGYVNEPYFDSIEECWQYIEDKIDAKNVTSPLQPDEFKEYVDNYLRLREGYTTIGLEARMGAVDLDTIRDVFVDAIEKPNGGGLLPYMLAVADEATALRIITLYVEDMKREHPVIFRVPQKIRILRIAAKHAGPNRKQRLLSLLDQEVNYVDANGKVLGSRILVPSEHVESLFGLAGEDIYEIKYDFLYKNRTSKPVLRDNTWGPDRTLTLIRPRERIDRCRQDIRSELFPHIGCPKFLLAAVPQNEWLEWTDLPPHDLYQEVLATHGIPTSVGRTILASEAQSQENWDWHFLALAAGGLKAEALDLARRKMADPESVSAVPYVSHAIAFLGLAGDSEDIPLLRSFLNDPGYQAYEKEAVLPALTVLGDPDVVEIWRDILAEPGEYESSLQAAMALRYLGSSESEEFLDALVTQDYLHDVEWYARIHPFDYGYSFLRYAQYFQSEAIESYLVRYLEHNTNWHQESRYSMVDCLWLNYPIFYEYADVILNTLMRNINSPKTRIRISAEGMLEGLLQIPVTPDTVLPGHRSEFWTPYVEAFLEDWRAARQANSSFVPN